MLETFSVVVFFFVSPGRAKSPSNSRTQTTLEKNEMLLNFPIHVGTQHREGRQPLRGCWCEVPGALMEACNGTLTFLLILVIIIEKVES